MRKKVYLQVLLLTGLDGHERRSEELEESMMIKKWLTFQIFPSTMLLRHLQTISAVVDHSKLR